MTRTLPGAGSVEAPALAAWSRHLCWPADPGLAGRLGAGTIAAAAAATARRVPGREAVRVGQRALTHRELDDQARRLASWLAAHGAAPGRRVLLASGNSLEYVVGYLAVLHAGAAVVAVNSMLTAAELAEIVAATDPVAALVAGPRREELLSLGGVDHVVALDGAGSDGLAAVLAGASPSRLLPPDPAGIAHLAFTAGTTGRPKPLPLSHGNVLASARAVMRAWRWREDDSLVHALPLQHGHGISGLHTALLAGSRLVLVPEFSPDALCRAVSDHAATVLFGVPTIYERLLAWGGAAGRLRGLRLATTGSAAMSPRTSDALIDVLGQRLLERYGLTETGFVLSNPYDERVAGSVGIALPGAEVCVVGRGGERCDDGAEGEIVVRGPQVFGGYLGAGLPPALDERGWFRTGDIGRVDPGNGYVHLAGRAKEIIITGGLNVYPREVELALEAVPGIADVAVVGLPSPRWGEQVTAFVVPAPGAALEPGALHASVAGVLAAYKRPKEYRVVAELPRNHMGKVVRSALVATAEE
jgi:malonyl-CoA/methylmalonyl-CoA synthetase